MSSSEVSREGLRGARPGRDALPGAKRPAGGRGTRRDGGGARRDGGGAAPAQYRGAWNGDGQDENRRNGRDRNTGGQGKYTGDLDTVDRNQDGRSEPGSYYGQPVLNAPVWEAREIAGYFFLGGLAGASSLVAAGAELTGRPQLARGARLGAAGAASLSLAALVKDLGRPARFLNMLRVVKPTSPMSIGTWILSGYAPAALAAAASDVTGRCPRAGRLATAGAALLGPAVASYTAVLVSNTAVPAWHEARREMPFLFTASAATAAAGLGLLTAADAEMAPVTRLAVAGAAAELLAGELLERRLAPVVRRGYQQGKARVLLRAGKALAAGGAVAAAAGAVTGSGRLRAGAGLALLAASACTRFGVFHAGMNSATDPAATVEPQRARPPAAAGVSPA